MERFEGQVSVVQAKQHKAGFPFKHPVKDAQRTPSSQYQQQLLRVYVDLFILLVLYGGTKVEYGSIHSCDGRGSWLLTLSPDGAIAHETIGCSVTFRHIDAGGLYE